METPLVDNPLHDNTCLNIVQQVNYAVCSIAFLLTEHSVSRIALPPATCDRIGLFLARQSRELLIAEKLLKKQGGYYEY